MAIPVTGIILAGGKSIRVGRNKAFLDVEGMPVIKRVIRTLRMVCRDCVIVANDIEMYQHLGLPVVRDVLPGNNAMGGLHAGLVHAAHDRSFVAGCDMPFINPALVEYLADESTGYDAVIPAYGGRLHPLCAVYGKNCIGPIERQIRAGNRRIRDLFDTVKTKRIAASEIDVYDPGGRSFININTLGEYDIAAKGTTKTDKAFAYSPAILH